MKIGSGKSILLDAISFVLYNKPFRTINKPQLVNSINKKQCMVEIDFNIGSSSYTVRRGIKPNVFEIYENGNLVDQDSLTSDYQEYLETDILHLTQKAFLQIIMIGRANYTPFMKLKAPERRAVIEDILDIQIFSKMKTILSEKVSKNKKDISENEHSIDLLQQEIDLHEAYQKQIEESNEKAIEEKLSEIEEIKNQIKEYEVAISNSKDKIVEIKVNLFDNKELQKKENELIRIESQLKQKMRTSKDMIEFLEENDSCPTCKQAIDYDFKQETIEKHRQTHLEIENGLAKLKKKMKEIEQQLEKYNEISNEIQQYKNHIDSNTVRISSKNNMISSLERDIEKLKKSDNKSKDTSETDNKIKKAKEELKKEEKRKGKLLEQQEIMKVCTTIVKDSGIKSQIVKQYVPLMNKMINKYLSDFDFFVEFTLNENFEETILSRYRDGFSYESFSEGQKMRIDIALLFTWRAIAKLRNSVSTNLLIMDETFDSSLDDAGIDEFLKIMRDLTGQTNIFIISHRGENLFDKFDRVLKFTLDKNFSDVKEI